MAGKTVKKQQTSSQNGDLPLVICNGRRLKTHAMVDFMEIWQVMRSCSVPSAFLKFSSLGAFLDRFHLETGIQAFIQFFRNEILEVFPKKGNLPIFFPR